jgi:hypothetical protein
MEGLSGKEQRPVITKAARSLAQSFRVVNQCCVWTGRTYSFSVRSDLRLPPVWGDSFLATNGPLKIQFVEMVKLTVILAWVSTASAPW